MKFTKEELESQLNDFAKDVKSFHETVSKLTDALDEKYRILMQMTHCSVLVSVHTPHDCLDSRIILGRADYIMENLEHLIGVVEEQCPELFKGFTNTGFYSGQSGSGCSGVGATDESPSEG